MKKGFLLVAVTLLLVMGMPRTSFASLTILPSFDEFRIVDSTGSLTDADTFNIDTGTPTLYVKLKDSLPFLGGFLSYKVKSTWEDDTSSEWNVSDTISIGENREAWLTLPNWDSVKKLGTWEVSGNYNLNKLTFLDSPMSYDTFTVTPEPMSMILFGMGGLPIAAHLLRRRKQVSV